MAQEYYSGMLMEGKVKRIEISDADLQKIKDKVEILYKDTKPINCPYFKGVVNFNARGLDHIKFKAWNKPRYKFDQYLRLKLFYLVPEILRRSHTVQGIWYRKEWVRQKKHAKWEKIIKDVIYYEFVAVIGKVRIKVVVKEVVGGEKFFWSIIPFWKMNEITGERKLYDDDLEQDTNIVSDLDINEIKQKSPVS